MTKIQRVLEELNIKDINANEGILDMFKKEKFKFRYFDKYLGKYVYGEKKSKNIHTAEKDITQSLKDNHKTVSNFNIVPSNKEFAEEPPVYSLVKAHSQVVKDRNKTQQLKAQLYANAV